MTRTRRGKQALHKPGIDGPAAFGGVRSSSLSSDRSACVIRPIALHPSLCSSREDYLSALQRLLELDEDTLGEGQFGFFRGKKPSRDFIR
jgi:hypothetical protein